MFIQSFTIMIIKIEKTQEKKKTKKNIEKSCEKWNFQECFVS